FLYLANNIFIDRENAKSAQKTMKFVASELRRKNVRDLFCVVIHFSPFPFQVGIFMFPEGTRSNQTDNSMLPFKQVGQ
ncbi:UNVERIFIED_CONTAM: hypothetical protein HDU68_011889, partial [Siphonaria sp. JEL0065]